MHEELRPPDELVAGPREFTTEGNEGIEVLIVRTGLVSKRKNIVRVRRFEELRSARTDSDKTIRKHIRLGDLDSDEWAEISDMVNDLLIEADKE